MGCDIHTYVEYRTQTPRNEYEQRWRGFGGRVNPGRNYSIFERMAGVRGDDARAVAPPRGLPDDTSYAANEDAWMWIAYGKTQEQCNENEVTEEQAAQYAKYREPEHAYRGEVTPEAAPPEDVCSRCGVRESQHRLARHDFLSTQYPEAAHSPDCDAVASPSDTVAGITGKPCNCAAEAAPPRATTARCVAVNRDGYQCELRPGHRGTLHRALIGAFDEQGTIPQVKWREIADGVVEPWSCEASCVGGGYPALCYMYPNETHAGCPRAPLAAHPATTPEPDGLPSPFATAKQEAEATGQSVGDVLAARREAPFVIRAPSRDSGALLDAWGEAFATLKMFAQAYDNGQCNLANLDWAKREEEASRAAVDRHLSTLARMREAIVESEDALRVAVKNLPASDARGVVQVVRNTLRAALTETSDG